MTGEHILIVETEIPIPFTCADATGILKGTVVQLADNMTVLAPSGNNEVVGGVIATEKIADDGMVRVGVYRRGIFKATASGSITTGDSLGMTQFKNELVSNRTTKELSGSKSVGTALQDATDGQTFMYELNVQNINSTL